MFPQTKFKNFQNINKQKENENSIQVPTESQDEMEGTTVKGRRFR